MSKIYHYTTIGTLALILKYKTIRFNRLDNVDDLEESMYGSGPNNLNLSKYVYVSCWTKNEAENLALWKMYAGYNGVRISLDDNMFVQYPNEPFNTFNSFFSKILYFGPDYCADQYTNKVELHDVNYVDNPINMVNSLININDNKMTINTGDLGLSKCKEWSIQNESRYKIQVLPLNYKYVPTYSALQLNAMNRENLTKANFELTPAIVRSISEVYIPQTQYLDMGLRDECLNVIEVMLGPQTNLADKTIVEALLQGCRNAKIVNSYFKGKIRNK